MRILFFIIILIFVLPAFSYEENLNNNIDGESDLRRFLLFQTNSGYKLEDGTKFNYIKTRKIILPVPENRKLLKQEKACRITSYILSCLSISMLGASIGMYYNDYSEAAYTTGASVFAVSTIYSVILQPLSRQKLRQSVNNYNHYIRRKKQI